MKKKFKPVPLDVDAIAPQTPAHEPILPQNVNQKYGGLLTSPPGPATQTTPVAPNTIYNKTLIAPVDLRTGLAEVPVGGVPPLGQDSGSEERVREGDLVFLKRHGKMLVECDARFTWKPKMQSVADQADPGEVKLIDDDSILVEIDGASMWLPACVLLPCILPDDSKSGYLTKDLTPTEEVGKGSLVAVRRNSKQVISASPYQVGPSISSLLRGDTVGVVVDHRRGAKASCRVQFGGFLWSLPLSSVSRSRGPEERGVGYLAAYSDACHKYNCKPNSELLKLLTTTPVTRIDLSNNYLGKKGLLCLAEVLCVNTSITDLSLPNNALCHDSVTTMLNVLRKDKLISSIDLSGNHFSYLTGRGIKQLVTCNPHITSIRLESTGIPDWMVKDITQQVTRNFDGKGAEKGGCWDC